MTGTELRQRRQRLGLSQESLASLLGVRQTTITRWERGARTIEHDLLLDRALKDLEREMSLRSKQIDRAAYALADAVAIDPEGRDPAETAAAYNAEGWTIDIPASDDRNWVRSGGVVFTPAELATIVARAARPEVEAMRDRPTGRPSKAAAGTA